MIFAIYKWLSQKPDKGVGNFTNGRLYLATADIDGALDMHHLRLNDDDDNRVTIDPDNGRFEYPSEVFGVIVKATGSRMPGEVVVINEADDDGEMLSIKGSGYVKASNIQLLDLVSVRPGMMIYDRLASRWKKIKRVDESMRIQVDDEMRECTDFVFAISDNELAMVPLVRCIDDTDSDLTKGLLYQVKGNDENGLLIINDDNGNEAGYSLKRFEIV